MKGRGRARQWLKTIGFAVIVLTLIAAATFTIWPSLSIGDDCSFIGIGGGAFWLQYQPVPMAELKIITVPTYASSSQLRITWAAYGRWPRYGDDPQISLITVPMWMVLCLVGPPTAWLWHLDRRPAPGKCRCGYDLTGNTSGKCPECGQISATA